MKAIDFSLDGRLDFVITSDFSVQVHKRCLYCGGRAKFSLAHDRLQLVNVRLADRGTKISFQEIEIATFIRLLDMF